MTDADTLPEVLPDVTDKVTQPDPLPLKTENIPASVPDPLPVEAEKPPAALPAFPAIGVPAAAAFDSAFDIATIEIEHARWLVSEGKEGKRANFRGLDLSGVDMSGRHLMEASLRGAILIGANLSGADLRAADLAEAVLDRANLNGTLLSAASLARAQLHEVQAKGADFTTVNFAASIAEGINLNGARLNGAILRDANFRHADFTHALLRDANLRGATLVEANLSGADLSSADCRDVNFDRASFAGAIMGKTNFRGAKLGGVDMQAADFSNALDVATEFQTQSLQSERIKLQEEQAQLAVRERAVAQDKEHIDTQFSLIVEMEAKQAQLALKLGKLSRGFIYRAVTWLIIVVLVGMLTYIRADEIGIGRMAGIMTGIGIVLLLAIFSMFRSIQVVMLVKKAIAAIPQNLEPQEESSSPVEPPLTSPAKNSKNKMAGFGLGKKK